MENRKMRNDLILALALIALSLSMLAAVYLTRRVGGEAIVRVDGEEVMRLPLSEEKTIVLGDEGDTNTLVISGGEAYISDADCPDKLCVRQGRVKYDGETIVCLPHRLVIEIDGGEKNPLDAVSQ